MTFAMQGARALVHFAFAAVLYLGLLSFGMAAAAPISTPAPMPTLVPPDNALRPEQLGIVINDSDALSVAIGNYYQQRRKIPAQNVVHLHFSTIKNELSPGEFAVQKKLLDDRLPATVQALALTWAAPYRVGCMSITAAFTFGFDVRYCAQGCVFSDRNLYAGSSSRSPKSDFQIRPSMMIAARDFATARALIERGIASDYSQPNGAAYLFETSDNARSVRKVFFPQIEREFSDRLSIHSEKSQSLKNAKDVMFYFTGLIDVPDISSNHFLPGAVADHLTSSGGQLTDSSQMSALRWLEAGATGSYGTVVEPCAFVEKFPNPLLFMRHYLAGETLLEAYWKSVYMPGQGVFIGEPLARPYGTYRLQSAHGH